MPTDKKEYNQDSYRKHPDIWKKNYEKNAPARRERARSYAENKWNNDPEYKKKHIENTIRRTRTRRIAGAIIKSTAKVFSVLEALL